MQGRAARAAFYDTISEADEQTYKRGRLLSPTMIIACMDASVTG